MGGYRCVPRNTQNEPEASCSARSKKALKMKKTKKKNPNAIIWIMSKGHKNKLKDLPKAKALFVLSNKTNKNIIGL